MPKTLDISNEARKLLIEKCGSRAATERFGAFIGSAYAHSGLKKELRSFTDLLNQSKRELNYEVRLAHLISFAILALGDAKPERYLPNIKAYFRDGYRVVRRAAATTTCAVLASSSCDVKRLINQYTPLIRNEDSAVVEGAFLGLGFLILRTQDIQPFLKLIRRRILKEESLKIHYTLCLGLCSCLVSNNPVILEELEKLVLDTSKRVRREAAFCVGLAASFLADTEENFAKKQIIIRSLFEKTDFHARWGAYSSLGFLLSSELDIEVRKGLLQTLNDVAKNELAKITNLDPNASMKELLPVLYGAPQVDVREGVGLGMLAWLKDQQIMNQKQLFGIIAPRLEDSSALIRHIATINLIISLHNYPDMSKTTISDLLDPLLKDTEDDVQTAATVAYCDFLSRNVDVDRQNIDVDQRNVAVDNVIKIYQKLQARKYLSIRSGSLIGMGLALSAYNTNKEGIPFIDVEPGFIYGFHELMYGNQHVGIILLALEFSQRKHQQE